MILILNDVTGYIDFPRLMAIMLCLAVFQIITAIQVCRHCLNMRYTASYVYT